MFKQIFQFSILFFAPLSAQAYDISLKGLAMEEKISWSILGITVVVCVFILGKILFVNLKREIKKKSSRRFIKMEKIYNMGTVLVFLMQKRGTDMQNTQKIRMLNYMVICVICARQLRVRSFHIY